jgi:hypothetical protein|tara:strand:+ start:162 stop:737 length:576 start_codon:yes stop_codon:yes gene_type:complete
MAIIYTYNTALPALDDILLGTEKDATLRNPTKNFKISDLAKFIIDSQTGNSLSVPLFFDVADPATGLVQTTLVDSIMTQDVNPNGTTLTIAGTISVTGAIQDSTASPGAQAQILSSTVTGTRWVDFTSSTFTFIQGVAATTWNITHNLNKFPSITVIDTGNTVVTGEYIYIDSNNVTLTFSAGFAGKAYLN